VEWTHPAQDRDTWHVDSERVVMNIRFHKYRGSLE
jgi:hypothetical protein